MEVRDNRPERGVVSFVRRSIRMNESQTKAWDRFSHRFVVDVPSGRLSTSVADDAHVDWDEVFGRSASRIVEIGSGNGDSLVPMAKARPDVDFIAFEVFQPAVASTLSRIGKAGIGNVRIVIADGARGLGILFETDSLSEVWTFFADPWHKTRHHKRRLVNPTFSDVVAERLVQGGLWRLATDWEDYADQMREVLAGEDRLERDPAASAEGVSPRFSGRVVTRYERKAREAGRAVRDLVAVRA